MKLLSFLGSEPSKVSGTLTLPTLRGVSWRRSSSVMRRMAFAKFSSVVDTPPGEMIRGGESMLQGVRVSPGKE